eukprot:1708523-Amphidinium_carterae.1
MALGGTHPLGLVPLSHKQAFQVVQERQTKVVTEIPRPAPVWDGKDPNRKWKHKRRDVLLWRDDQVTPPEKLGVRMFRALTGKTLNLAQRFAEIAQKREFESALLVGSRASDESFLALLNRKQVDLARYEQTAGEALPDHTKARTMLRHARLDDKQAQGLHTWMEGKRDYHTVCMCLSQLDADAELITTAMGTDGHKHLFEDVTWNQDSYLQESWRECSASAGMWSEDSAWYDGDWWLGGDDDPDEVWLYGEEHDVGEDCDEEDSVWVYAEDLASAELLPRSLKSGSSNKKSERQEDGPCLPRAKSKHKSKGKDGKGKGKHKKKGPWFAPQEWRDQRRMAQGITRVKKSELVARRVKLTLKFFKCGRIGNHGPTCVNSFFCGFTGQDSESYMQQLAVWEADSCFVFLQIPPSKGLLDTGA